jgi:CRISPR/Cas system-associated exonuclease Cas4 (RecB family)
MAMNFWDKNNFLFTQHSLTTFDNCPLKFKKRYIENIKWDSFKGENEKKRLETGNAFHLMAQRYFLGIETGLQEEKDDYQELNKWVSCLKNKFPLLPDEQYFPEYKLRMNTSLLKLEANFDLLIIKDDKIVIWDWKTHSGSKNESKLLKKRLVESNQSMVYLFMLKENANLIIGKELQHQNINMYYWQPEPEGIVAEIHYNQETHESYREILESKIQRIYAYDYSIFNKELYRKHCKFCEFNWFCNKEVVDFQSIANEDSFMEDPDIDIKSQK